MTMQVDQEMFSKALSELGHDPGYYHGKKISLDDMCKVYEVERDSILDAIEGKHLSAHYDYKQDLIFIDALEAAHFYYCVRSHLSLF